MDNYTGKIKDSQGSYIEAKDLKGCLICGMPTNRIDYIIEDRICSKECSDKFYGVMNELCDCD